MNKNWDMELYFVKHGTGGGFTTQLFDLIAKADTSNRYKIWTAFPEAVEAWQRWYESPSEDQHWRELGFQK